MSNCLKRDKKLLVLHHLVEGNSIRSTERLTGVHRDTIMRLLVRVGNQCREFLDDRMQGLTLDHVEVDEIWTFCRKKEGRLTSEEREDPTIGDIYLFVPFDKDTKLVPTFAIGKRTAKMARALMRDLAGRLVFPKPHDSDPHAFRPATAFQYVTQVSTDGYPPYPEAVDLAFGPYVKYGQCIKDYRSSEQPGRYGPPEIVGTDPKPIFGIREDEKPTICTSHVERHNLTIRLFVKRFARLTTAFSKKLENLAAACALHFAYYNFCWRPRKPGKSGQRRVTPAMAAGLTDRLWSFEDLLREVGAI